MEHLEAVVVLMDRNGGAIVLVDLKHPWPLQHHFLSSVVIAMYSTHIVDSTTLCCRLSFNSLGCHSARTCAMSGITAQSHRSWAMSLTSSPIQMTSRLHAQVMRDPCV
jgi:hypothetical protein